MNNRKLITVSNTKEICDITVRNSTHEAFNAWSPLSGTISIPAGQQKCFDVIVGELFYIDGRYVDAPGECFYNEYYSDNIRNIDDPDDPNHFYFIVTYKLPPSKTIFESFITCPNV